jgi:hypothetical protein
MQASQADLRRRVPDLALIETFCEAQGFGMLLRRQAERLSRTASSDLN